MTPIRMELLVQFLCWGCGALCGLMLAFVSGAWSGKEFLFWPAFMLYSILFLGQQYMTRKVRSIQLKEEAEALEQMLEMQHEVDKTARRYKCLLEGAGNAIFVFNADNSRLQEVNRKGTELLGYSKEEMLALAGKDLTPAFERRRFSDLVRRVKRRGRGRAESLTFRGKNGNEFLGEVEARLIDLGDEKVVHVTVRDITYKNQAEKEIKQRNRELSILNTIIARANESLQLDTVLDNILSESLEAFGAEAGMISLVQEEGAGMSVAVHRNLQEEMIQRIGRHNCPSRERYCSHALPTTQQKSCQLVQAAGASEWRFLAGMPLFANKKVIGVLHILSKTEHTYTQEDIRFFTTIGHQIGMVIDHARVFAELSWKTDELLRSYSLLEKSSHQLAISQKRLKMNLALVERANKDLARLDRMKTHFLGIVSHEFRTPLTSIMGGTQFLLSSSHEWSEEEQRLLAIVHEGGTRLNDIVSNLLKVARLESKSFTLTKSPVSLGELLRDLHKHILPLLEDRSQQLLFRDIEIIPYINADHEYLEEIFSQLLENAIKFSRDGGEIIIMAQLVDVSILEQKRNILTLFNEHFLDHAGPTSFIQVEIRDSGIGIDEDDHLHIFDKFYGAGDIRHHSSGRSKFQGKGPGLGLSIVKGMVEAHGGMVWVESPCQDMDEQPGSSFFVLIPTEEAQLQPALPFLQERPDFDPPGMVNPLLIQ